MAGPRTDSLTAATLALSPGEPSNWQGRRARPGDQWHGACVRVFQVRGTGCHCSAEPVPRTLPVCQLHCKNIISDASDTGTATRDCTKRAAAAADLRSFILQITDSDHDIHWQDHRRAVAARRRRGGVGGHRRGRRSGPGTGISSSSQAGNAARPPASGRPGRPGGAARRGCQWCGRVLSR